MIPWIQAFLAISISGIAAYTDRRNGTIPNTLCFFGIGAGVILGVAGGGEAGALSALAGAFVGFCMGCLVFLFKWVSVSIFYGLIPPSVIDFDSFTVFICPSNILIHISCKGEFGYL